jgi:hypothetical protein
MPLESKMNKLIKFIPVFLIFFSNIVFGEAYLICDWSKESKNEYVDFFHMHSKKEKNGISYFSRANWLTYPNQQKVKLKFKTKCGFFDEFICNIATAESYQFGPYILNRKSLVVTSRLVVGGELPKSTQCESVTKETWLFRQKPTNLEKNQI